MSDALDNVTDSYTRLNKKIVDNAGLTINMSEIPEMKALRNVQHKLYGGNFIVRILKGIYFFFSPYKKMALQKGIESLTRLSAQAVLNKTIEKGEEAIDNYTPPQNVSQSYSGKGTKGGK